MLNNERFVANAPADVVKTNKEALKHATLKLEKIKEELKAIG